jgi:hypothetical protein
LASASRQLIAGVFTARLSPRGFSRPTWPGGLPASFPPGHFPHNGVTNMKSPLDELTQNPIRSHAILSIVQEAIDAGEPLTLENVAPKAEKFGESFGALQADEFSVAVELLRPAEFEADETSPPVSEQSSDVPRRPTMTRDQATKQLQSLKDDLYEARRQRMKAEDGVRAARAAMATAIGEWNGQGGGYTREMLIRDHIAANQQRKLDIAEGRISPRSKGEQRIANSYFDRIGAYGRGDANSFVRKGHVDMQTGKYHPWRGGNRGALPLSMLRGPLDTKGGAAPLGPNPVAPDNTK